MLKKLVSAVLAVTMLISLSACKDKKNKSEDEKENDPNSNSMYNVAQNEEGTIFITYDGKLKTIDKQLNDDFYYGRNIYEDESGKGIIDIDENVIVDYGKYKSINFVKSFDDYLPYFEVTNKDNKHGIIDKDGNEIIECKYADINIIFELDVLYAFIAIDDDDKETIYNAKGKEIDKIETDNLKYKDHGTIYGGNDLILSLFYEKDGNEIAKVYNMESGKLLKEYAVEDGTYFSYSCFVSPEGVQVMNKDGEVVFTLDKEFIKENFDESPDKIYNLTAFYSDGYLQITCSDRYYILLNSDLKVIYKSKEQITTKIVNGKIYIKSSNYDDKSEILCDEEGKEIIKTDNYILFDYTANKPFFSMIDKNIRDKKSLYGFDGKLIANNVDVFTGGYIDLEKNKTIFIGESLDQVFEADSDYKYLSTLIGNYIIISNQEKCKVIDFSAGKEIFEYDYSKHNSVLGMVKAIKLDDGYYTYNGEKICDLEGNK